MISSTCLERHGVLYGIKTAVARQARAVIEPQVAVKRRATMLERHGVEHAFQSPVCQAKSRETTRVKYGVPYFSQSREWVAACQMTSRERYGVDWTFQSANMKAKSSNTCLQRYGVPIASKHDDVIAKMLATGIKNWGCNPSAHPDIKRRKHETMKRNGSYAKSSVEDRFYAALCELYGVADVERHVTVNGWSIDFRIISTDTYIQFDGVYWHGLDRPIEVIREHKNPRDVTIEGTWERDQKQNEWFRANGLLLIRITDTAFSAGDWNVSTSPSR